MFDDDKQISFQHHAEGTWGEFATSAGRINYILTKARLGKASTDKERRLTGLLRPVREVLDPTTLNFNQLLQRDLDDHRVSHGLIPYLLSRDPTGPAFFPPIVAVLLPFEGIAPVTYYPASSGPEQVEEGGARYSAHTYGHTMQVRRLANKDGSLHTIKLGRVSWNEETAKLVVIDGQHRAMALIAIDRSIRKAWDEGSGGKYRHFYETKIEELLAGETIDLERIEIPVTLCWFPDATPNGIDAHKAARKIFVDVNKEAKPPSEARLILLSDGELVNILTRSLLNALRETNSRIPLFAVEYDNPEVDAELPVRWTVLTNLNLLKYAVLFTVFVPARIVTKMDQKFGGRPPEREMNSSMRNRLRINDLFEEIVYDGEQPIPSSTIANKRFPLSRVEEIEKEFLQGWGSAILELLSGLLPYAAHITALKELQNNWIQDKDVSGLAYEALFNGVGMYWTLRSSADSYAKRLTQARLDKRPVPMKPDVVSVWEYIDQLKDPNGGKRPRTVFYGQRTNHYLGKGTEAAHQDAEGVYDVVNTHACQLGLVMALTAIAETSGRTKGAAVADLARVLVAAWNASLGSKSAEGRDRRLVFIRTDPNEIDDKQQARRYYINRIRRMDTPMSVYFRYFWLELLALPIAREKWSELIDVKKIDSLRSTARRAYLDYLVAEQLKAVQQTHANKSPDWQRSEALKIESSALKKALRYWFDISESEFEAWLTSANAEPEPKVSQQSEEPSTEPTTTAPDMANSDSIEEDE